LLNYDYEVGESSFQYGKYEYINIIGGNPQIEESAFSSCEKLKEINITDCNIEVDKYGFYNGGKDMAITFNNCTGTIDESAFQYCDAVSIEINNCDLEINKSAFSSCEDLEYISFSNSKLTTEEYAFYNGGDSAIVEMTDCELYFDDSAFQYCSIESLTINGSSVDMEKSVFSSCEDLTTVTIDCDSVILGEYAFYNCKDLIDVSICDNSKSENEISIDDSAFQYCEDLESVTIGSGTIKIGKYVFSGSDKNPTITIAGQTYTADQIRDGIK
jgi:hypothetical protein